jgi:hypothetical protein
LFGSPPLSFGINYKNETVNDGIALTATKTAVATDESGSPISLPKFVTYNPATNLFKVEGVETKDFGTYTIALKIGYKEYASFDLLCKTRLEVTYKPGFVGGTISDQKFSCGQSFTMVIPKYTDAFGNAARVDVDMMDSAQVFFYSPTFNNITTQERDTKKLAAGVYKIQVQVSDS